MSNTDENSRDDKRAQARAHAAELRQAAEKKKRRRRYLIQVVIGVVVLAIIGTVVGVVVTNNHSAATISAKSKSTKAGPANMLSDGILLEGKNGTISAVRTAGVKANGSPTPTDDTKLKGTANIIEFVDLQCPYCKEFEATNLPQVEKWVAAGKATVEIHPISFLNASSEGTEYSTRADNAMACVANFDPDDFLTVMGEMYKKQPAEQTSGLTNAQIISILSGAGAGGKAIAGCVNGEVYKSWVAASTELTVQEVFAGNVSTPTVAVNDKEYAGSLTDASAFAAFVDKEQPGTTD